jgi:hypothetical protein
MLRVVIAMRVHEGFSGVVTAYVVPKNAPRTCNRVICSIKALSLHRRIREPIGSLPFSHLAISGDFLACDVHQWLLSCLPDMPKYAPGSDTKLVYESAMFKTQVIISYEDSSIKLSSDNVCALSILRDTITRCARCPVAACPAYLLSRGVWIDRSWLHAWMQLPPIDAAGSVPPSHLDARTLNAAALCVCC